MTATSNKTRNTNPIKKRWIYSSARRHGFKLSYVDEFFMWRFYTNRNKKINCLLAFAIFEKYVSP